MAESGHEIHENLQEAHEKGGSKWIAVYIAIMAVALAVTNMGASNAMKDMLTNNVSASNYWSFFQAKTIRQTTFRVAADDLAVLAAINPTMPDAAKQQVDATIKRYRDTAARYESDPKEGDGRKELMAKARAHEKERDVAQRKDPYFDFGEALIQIAIVLASVSLITGARLLLGLSIVMSLCGGLLSLNGFTLWMKVGFLEH
ncbi:MAG: DUF4337 domain-containing protein [Rhodospirillaceae bacterium]|nr:DUF4337 domain-containing protein [Rhodospirillaceae bacterium]